MLRLGVVGFGRRTHTVISGLIEVDPTVTIVGLVDPRVEELRAQNGRTLADAEEYGDLEAMISRGRLDGIVVGTRCELHAPYAITALKSGIPLFLEKPVAINWDQLDELSIAARNATSPVVVSFPLRVSEVISHVKTLLDADAIGAVAHVQAVNNVAAYGVHAYYHGWMRNESQTGGLWLQKATHDLDYLTYLIGSTPIQLCAMESKNVFTGTNSAGLTCNECSVNSTCVESPLSVKRRGEVTSTSTDDWRCVFAVDTGNHDSASVLVAYESGVHLSYSQNFFSRTAATARGATIIGHRGTIRFDFHTGVVTHINHFTGETIHHTAANNAGTHYGGDRELARDFINICRGHPRSRTPLESGLLSARLCLAARDSCREGRYRTIAFR